MPRSERVHSMRLVDSKLKTEYGCVKAKLKNYAALLKMCFIFAFSFWRQYAVALAPPACILAGMVKTKSSCLATHSGKFCIRISSLVCYTLSCKFSFLYMWFSPCCRCYPVFHLRDTFSRYRGVMQRETLALWRAGESTVPSARTGSGTEPNGSCPRILLV